MSMLYLFPLIIWLLAILPLTYHKQLLTYVTGPEMEGLVELEKLLDVEVRKILLGTQHHLKVCTEYATISSVQLPPYLPTF